MDKTKEKILQIARTWAGLDEKAFLALLKEKKTDGKFKPENWEKYIAAIKEVAEAKEPKETVCEFCQAPMKRRRWEGSFPRLSVCSKDETHTFICRTANLIQIVYPELDRKTALQWAAGPDCRHGLPLACCIECGQLAMRANIEKNDPIKEEEI